MRRKSNFEPPLASNPANGINNIPLGGEDSSVKKSDLKEVLELTTFDSLKDLVCFCSQD